VNAICLLSVALASALVGCTGGRSAASALQGEPAAAATVPPDPPLIHNGVGHLDCTISARENGSQRLVIKEGAGLEFDVIVSPIVDGIVHTSGPEQGGSYRFTSHLARAGRGELAGVGPVSIEELETRVNVEMKRYKQPGGAGTTLTFASEDMASRGIYVEFAGRARAPSGDAYAFRITLGQPGPGSGGAVTPEGPGKHANILEKMVRIEAPQTTVVTSSVTTAVSKVR
jgi:hypothetical protein